MLFFVQSSALKYFSSGRAEAFIITSLADFFWIETKPRSEGLRETVNWSAYEPKFPCLLITSISFFQRNVSFTNSPSDRKENIFSVTICCSFTLCSAPIAVRFLVVPLMITLSYHSSITLFWVSFFWTSPGLAQKSKMKSYVRMLLALRRFYLLQFLMQLQDSFC